MSTPAGDPASIVRASVERVFADAIDPALLADAAAGQWCAGLWATCCELGLDGLRVPEPDGAGGTWEEARQVVRACGHHLAPVPVPEALAARALMALAGVSQPAGVVTLAPGPLHLDPDGSVRGRLARVPFGRHADWIVAASANGHELLLMPAAGIAWEPGTNLAGEPRDDASLGAHPCAAVGKADAAPWLPWLGALLRATQIAGAGSALLARTTRHALDREQFGRPLARFQVIQHGIARLAGQVALVDAVTARAWRALDQVPRGRRWNRDARLVIAAARVTAEDCAGEIAALAHQVHGAIGFTDEYPLHHATRRLWSWRAEFGAGGHWAATLGALAIRRGGVGLWADITAVTDP